MLDDRRLIEDDLPIEANLVTVLMRDNVSGSNRCLGRRCRCSPLATCQLRPFAFTPPIRG
jgi:hypothetical protein